MSLPKLIWGHAKLNLLLQGSDGSLADDIGLYLVDGVVTAPPERHALSEVSGSGGGGRIHGEHGGRISDIDISTSHGMQTNVFLRTNGKVVPVQIKGPDVMLKAGDRVALMYVNTSKTDPNERVLLHVYSFAEDRLFAVNSSDDEYILALDRAKEFKENKERWQIPTAGTLIGAVVTFFVYHGGWDAVLENWFLVGMLSFFAMFFGFIVVGSLHGGLIWTKKQEIAQKVKAQSQARLMAYTSRIEQGSAA